MNGCRAPTRATGKLCKDSIEFPKRAGKNLRAAAAARSALFFFQISPLRKVCFRFMFLAVERERRPRPITNPSFSLIPNEMAKICFTRVSPCSSFKAGSLQGLQPSAVLLPKCPNTQGYLKCHVLCCSAPPA